MRTFGGDDRPGAACALALIGLAERHQCGIAARRGDVIGHGTFQHEPFQVVKTRGERRTGIAYALYFEVNFQGFLNGPCFFCAQFTDQFNQPAFIKGSDLVGFHF